MLVQTFSGRQMRVDLEEFVPYEVSEMDANDFLASRLREVLVEMKERILSFRNGYHLDGLDTPLGLI